MLEIPHVLVGAAIGIKIANPFFALPLALLSHFLLDLIPHWNPSLYTETEKYGHPTKKSTRIVFIDSLLSLFLGFLIAGRVWPDFFRFLIIIFACFLAVLPDLIEAPFFYLNFKPPLLKRWIDWQRSHQGRAPKIPGLLVQLATIIISLAIIFI